MSIFQDNLREGLVGESEIATWLRRGGFSVLPAYEKVVDDFKGPRFYSPTAELVSPDMLAFKHGQQLWIEAKTKTRFSWFGSGGYWVTGINYKHYLDYLQVEKETGLPVCVMFLHRESETWPQDIARWGAPRTCPTGLFYCRLTTEHSHKHKDWKGVEMIYWSLSRLKQLVPLDAFVELTGGNGAKQHYLDR